MTRLRVLHGTWRGAGSGDYPTIEAFRYDETLRVEFDARYPMIHYEQRTTLTPSGEASHWESGFVRVVDGQVEVSSSQDSGRVEVLRGPARFGEGDDDVVLTLDSVALAHDPRLVRTRRVLTLRGATLGYVKWMATRTTPAPELLQHLSATLMRQGRDA